MFVCIAGSRDFSDYEVLAAFCDRHINPIPGADVTIISGTAKGADTLGERYARERGYDLVRMPADWEKHGKSAGYIRNEEMARVADMAIIFWDGKSKGTGHMIDLCREYGVHTEIFRF